MNKGVGLLLNSGPESWGSRDDMFLRLCLRASEAGFRPVLITSQALPDASRRRYEEVGVTATALDYRQNLGRIRRDVCQIVTRHSIVLVNLRFFSLHSIIPWLLWTAGIERIVFTDAESGLLTPSQVKRHLLRLRNRVVIPPINEFIAISEFVRERLIERGVAASKVDVVYNAVDDERFCPNAVARARLVSALNLDPRQAIVTTIGGLLPFKNTATLIEALAILTQRGRPVRLLVAGDGPLRNDLEALSKRLGVADRVTWLGFIADPVPVLQGSEVFAFPSIGEAFGNVLVEAMACGLPVVASRSGGVPEIVGEGESGILVPEQQASAFADALEILIDDACRRRNMGMRGRQIVQERFSLDRFAQETIAVYEGALGRRAFR